jgi:peptide-methionine (R)-S-oxide reductase
MNVSSETKYDSGSGWPSFFKSLPYEAEKETVERRPDDSIEGRPRIEVVCTKVNKKYETYIINVVLLT